MELRVSPLLIVLCVGIVLGNIPQDFARSPQVSCNKTQYKNDDFNICCSRCPPGYFRKERCTPESDTLCLQCPNGTFAANWNYASVCRTCYPCGPALVEKEPCTAIHDRVCVCPDGYYCSLHGAPNERCMLCVPESISTESPTVVTVVEKSGWKDMEPYYWIIIGVALFAVSVMIALMCLKHSVLKRFGRVLKNEICSTSTPQTETPVAVHMDVLEGPVFPLLKGEPIKKPMQEQGKDLNYPIQETSTDIGESTLLPKRGE